MDFSQRILYLFLVIIIAGAAAMGGAAFGSIFTYRIISNRLSDQIPQPVQNVPVGSNSDGGEIELSTTEFATTITQAVETVGPAVVTVVGFVSKEDPFFNFSETTPVSGSGVIVADKGYVITNNHVVEGVQDLIVVLADGDEIPAQLIGGDKYADLAVLKFEGKVPAVAKLGDSNELKPGESVIAIGSPLGDFKNSVTMGVVSGTGRNIDTGEGYEIENLIQTDAAINQGNSGGPLVNLAGEVVGINTLIVRGGQFGSAIAEGLGFAIPSNTAQFIAEQLIENGYFARPYLGIRSQPVTPGISAAYNLPVDWGMFIVEVEPGSPASISGIRNGDIITRIGQVSINEDSNFLNALFSHRAGQSVPVHVIRNGDTLVFEVVLGESKNQ
jgi:2-alkenal reductase